jgi:hypothetical protein
VRASEGLAACCHPLRPIPKGLSVSNRACRHRHVLAVNQWVQSLGLLLLLDESSLGRADNPIQKDDPMAALNPSVYDFDWPALDFDLPATEDLSA